MNKYKLKHSDIIQLTLSEYINIVMTEHNISFGEVLRKIIDHYSITESENELNIIDCLWELNTNDKVF